MGRDHNRNLNRFGSISRCFTHFSVRFYVAYQLDLHRRLPAEKRHRSTARLRERWAMLRNAILRLVRNRGP